MERFEEEGRRLYQLSEHPTIVKVLDFDKTERGVPFLVLEWLEGRDLASELAARRSPLSEAEAVALLRPAVEALAFAHELGIAHRDVKPQNLFVTRTARGLTLKVLDFGIAKAMQEGETATALATKTSSGFQAFSPVYGAPEQFASKKHGQTGPWTDVHALGLVLTEMVSGQSPYKGKSWPTGPWRPCRPSGLRHARAVPA